MTKHDPLDAAYQQAGLTDKAITILFYIGGALSFTPLFIKDSDILYTTQVLFIIVIIFAFTLGLVLRLFIFPDIEDRRAGDFMSQAYNSGTSADISSAYYNNGETKAEKKAGAQLLEDLFFTKAITQKMVASIRYKTILYFAIWLFFALHHSIELSWIVIIAQTIFSEEIIARWIRLEWLRVRCERLYTTVYTAHSSNLNSKTYNGHIFTAFIAYERTKAIASTLLSSKIFHKINPSLSEQWNNLKIELQITQ